jgi:mRNA interferase HigB
MDVVKRARVMEYRTRHPAARAALDAWLQVTRAAAWRSFEDLRPAFGRNVDEVVVQSGRKVVVFNIGGNKFRLITAIHYNRGKVFVLRFLSHADYSKDRWKDQL